MDLMSGRHGGPRLLTVATADGMVCAYNICERMPSKSKKKHDRDAKLRNFPCARFAPKEDTACISAVAVDWSARDGQGKGEGWVLAGGVGEKVYVYPLSWHTATKTRDELADYAKLHDEPPHNEVHPTLDAPVHRPTFVLKLPASITNLSVQVRGEYRQMVIGMEQPRTAETHGTGKGGKKAAKVKPPTIIAYPQLCAFLYEDTIPYSFLRLMTSVDCANTDPNMQFATVASAMRKTDPCAISVSSGWFFTYLARQGSATGLKKTLFAAKIKERIPCVTVSYYKMLENLLDGYNTAELGFDDKPNKLTNKETETDGMVKDYGKCVQRIFKEMARSVKNHNDFSLGYARSMYRHRQFNSVHNKDNLVELLVADPNWTDDKKSVKDAKRSWQDVSSCAHGIPRRSAACHGQAGGGRGGWASVCYHDGHQGADACSTFPRGERGGVVQRVCQGCQRQEKVLKERYFQRTFLGAPVCHLLALCGLSHRGVYVGGRGQSWADQPAVDNLWQHLRVRDCCDGVEVHQLGPALWSSEAASRPKGRPVDPTHDAIPEVRQ
jgi:hypothetical protein